MVGDMTAGQITRQVVFVVVGSTVSAYGITLAIHAGFCSATLAVLWQGISKVSGLSLGGSSMLVAVIMIAIAWKFDPTQIGIGTILYQIVYSPLVDVFSILHRYSGFAPIDFVLMLTGIAIFAVGIGTYSATDLGRGSYEAFSFALAQRFNRGISKARIACDVSVVALGFVLGGVFGLCTICTIFMSGPIIGATVKRVRRFVQPDFQTR